VDICGSFLKGRPLLLLLPKLEKRSTLQYDTCAVPPNDLQSALDIFALTRRRTRRHRRHVVRWLTSECVEARRHRRRLERCFQRTRFRIDRRAFRATRANRPVDCCVRRDPTTSDSSWTTPVATHVVIGARSTNSFTLAVVTGYRVTQPTTPVWQTASMVLSLTN